MPDVVVLGSLNMDLVVRTERMPRPGETVMGERFVTVPGVRAPTRRPPRRASAPASR